MIVNNRRHNLIGLKLTRLKIIVDNRRFNFIEVLECMDDLHDDGACLAFRNALVLLQVKVEVVSIAVLKHSAERVGVDLEHVIQANHSGMIQLLMDVVFAQCVLYVIGLLVVLPVFVQLMDFAGHVTLILQVECFVHFGESACNTNTTINTL